MAIRAGKVTEPTLIARRVGSTRVCLVASPAYLAAHGTPTSVDDLDSHDCLTVPSASGRVRWLLQGPDGPVEVEVRGRFQANTAFALLKACIADMGVASLPDAQCDLAHRRMCARTLILSTRTRLRRPNARPRNCLREAKRWRR